MKKKQRWHLNCITGFFLLLLLFCNCLLFVWMKTFFKTIVIIVMIKKKRVSDGVSLPHCCKKHNKDNLHQVPN